MIGGIVMLKCERKKKFIEKFEGLYPDFKYYAVYTSGESSFKMKCKICGHIQQRHGSCVRLTRNKKLQCDNCNRKIQEVKKERSMEKQRRKSEMKLIRILKNKVKEMREPSLYKECKKCGKEFKAGTSAIINCDICVEQTKKIKETEQSKWRGKIVVCSECGKEFKMKTKKSKHCSKQCINKWYRRISEIQRRKVISLNGKVDWNISIEKLSKNNNNICGICGKACNENDYVVDETGTFIANVQLAHRGCNSHKGDTIYKSIKGDGQLSII